MQKRGEWTVKNSKIVYQNPWITVREDEVVRPDGHDGVYGTVDIMPGVMVLAIDPQNVVYLLKNYLYAIDQTLITTAGGGIDHDETVFAAAQRELREETGIIANKFTSLGTYPELDASTINTKTELFLAEDLSFTETEHEGTEKLEVIKMTLEQAVAEVMNGQISHPLTALAILKTHLRQNPPTGS